MARANRTWLEERGLTNLSAFVNGLISDRIRQEEALAEGKSALSRVQRLESRLSDAQDDATDLAAQHLAEHATTTRLAAMLLARLQGGALDLNPHVADALAGFIHNETPDLPEPAQVEQPKARKVRRCSYCGETGHDRRTCPKKHADDLRQGA